MKRVKQASIATLLLAGGLAASSAWAYILPAEAILGGVGERRDQLGYKTLVLEGSVIEAGGQPVPVWEAFRDGSHRREVRRPEGARVTLRAQKKLWKFGKGVATESEREKRPDLILTFLGTDGEKIPKLAGGFLKAYGIDEEVVSLARLGETVAYIIGAMPWETDKPQLWIAKELRAPVRLVYLDGPDKAMTDIRLLGYESPQMDEWFPRRIEVRRNGELVETTTYHRVSVNEEVDNDLFAPPSSR